MAGLFAIKELSKRRDALVQESEVYRRALVLDFQNLQIAGAHARQQFLAVVKPAFMVLTALAGVLTVRNELRYSSRNGKPRKKRSMAAWALLAFRLYRRFGPVVMAFLARAQAKAPSATTQSASTPASGPDSPAHASSETGSGGTGSLG